MMRVDSDHTCMTLLRNAANDACGAGMAKNVTLKARDSALRDVLSQAGRHLAAVDIDVRVHDHGALALTARTGGQGVYVSLRESTDGVTITGRVDGAPIPIRWNTRTFQWEGRQTDNHQSSEPAWYTLAKKVVADLATPAGSPHAHTYFR